MSAIATRDKSLVEQAYALAVPTEKVDGAKEELEALIHTRRVLLPVEEKASHRLQQRITELEKITKQTGFTEPRLPLEPLSWRWKNGLPKLALLSLGSASFNITAQRRGGSVHHSMNPKLPYQLAATYKDVVQLAQNACIRERSSKSFTFTFDGVIPSSTRQTIAEAMRSNRFEDLFMLVESPEKAWKVETVKGISRHKARLEAFKEAWERDPLILGWAADALWVLDKFDLTTLEEYVLDEFSQKALLPGS